MIRYEPVAVSDRDGFGRVLGVEVATGELRHGARILAGDGTVAGEVTNDGTVHWDPPPRISAKIAPDSVRRALATNGRFKAAVDERGVVLCLRAEPPRRIETRSTRATTSAGKSRKSYSAPDDERIEYFTRPARIIAVGGRQKGARW